MSLPRRHYYHYTALDHAEEILAAGGLTKGGIAIPSAGGTHVESAVHGWQWLTRDDSWSQGWATQRLVHCDRTEVRIVVEIPLLALHRLHRWDDVAADFGYSGEVQTTFTQLGGGDSSSWYVFDGMVPRAWFKAVESRPGVGAGVPTCAASLRDARADVPDA